MANVFDYNNFRTFLKDELERRSLRNPSYSLRAFARDLELSFSRLSEILNSKEGISIASAQKISKALRLSDTEQDFFINLILAKHSRNPHMKKKSIDKLKKLRSARKFLKMSPDFDGILSRWYYLLLIEILCLNAGYTNAQIADILKINTHEVVEASRTLLTLGYVQKNANDEWVKSTPFMQIDSTTPSKLVRDYHRKLMQKAEQALEVQPIENRKYMSAIMALNKTKLAEARHDLEIFKTKFLKKYAATEDASTVYGLNFQFFEFGNQEGPTA